MEHTQEWHAKEVELLCRLCCKFVDRGKRLKQKRIYPTSKQKYEGEIRHFFKINISHDIVGKHSSRICHSCAMNISNLKNNPLTLSAVTKAHEKGQSADRIFCTYDNNLSIQDCTLCVHVQSQRPGQRGLKRKADTSPTQTTLQSTYDESTHSAMETSSLQTMLQIQQEQMAQQTFQLAPQSSQHASLAQQLPPQTFCTPIHTNLMPHTTYPKSFHSNPMIHHIYPAMPQHTFPIPHHAQPLPHHTQPLPHHTYAMQYEPNSIPYPTSQQIHNASFQVSQQTYNPELHIPHSHNTEMNGSSDLSGLAEQDHGINRPAEQLGISFNPMISSHVASCQTQNDFTPQIFSTPKKQIKLKPDHSPIKKSPKISPFFKRKKRHFGTSPIKPLNLMSFCNKPVSDREISNQKKACAKLLSNLSSENSDTIVIPSTTKGQPKIYKRITKPRKKSSEICKTTLKKRVKEQANIRNFISGGDSLVQQSAETFHLPKVQTNSLRQILGKGKVIINKKVGAALQTHAQLSYCQFNKIKRVLREYLINFENKLLK